MKINWKKRALKAEKQNAVYRKGLSEIAKEKVSKMIYSTSGQPQTLVIYSSPAAEIAQSVLDHT